MAEAPQKDAGKRPLPGSPEARLADFLVPRDWV